MSINNDFLSCVSSGSVEKSILRSSSDSDLKTKIRTRSKIRRSAALYAVDSADLLFNPLVSDRKNILQKNRHITQPKIDISSNSVTFDGTSSCSLPNVCNSDFVSDIISIDSETQTTPTLTKFARLKSSSDAKVFYANVSKSDSSLISLSKFGKKVKKFTSFWKQTFFGASDRVYNSKLQSDQDSSIETSLPLRQTEHVETFQIKND